MAIYLNDHLAGGTGAIDQVNRAATDFAGEPLGGFLSQLAIDIQQDHDHLELIWRSRARPRTRSSSSEPR